MFGQSFMNLLIVYMLCIISLNGRDKCSRPGSKGCKNGKTCLGHCEIVGELCHRDFDCPDNEECTNFKCRTADDSEDINDWDARQSYTDILDGEYDDDGEYNEDYYHVETMRQDLALRMLNKGY